MGENTTVIMNEDENSFLIMVMKKK